MARRKKTDLAIVAGYLVVITAVFFLFRPDLVNNHIAGTILYFLVPVIYLTVRYWKSSYKHAIIFSWVFGLLGGLVAEIISRSNHLWTYSPFFPLFSLRNEPMEAIFWYVLYLWITVTVYKVFFERHHHLDGGEFYRNHLSFFAVLVLLFAIFIVAYVFNPGMFVTDFAYAKTGLILVVIPMIYALVKHPNLIGGILKAGLFMVILSLVYEIVGLHLGWWFYDTQSLKMIPLGGVVLPVEEILFWIILGSACTVVWYEEFERNLA